MGQLIIARHNIGGDLYVNSVVFTNVLDPLSSINATSTGYIAGISRMVIRLSRKKINEISPESFTGTAEIVIRSIDVVEHSRTKRTSGRFFIGIVTSSYMLKASVDDIPGIILGMECSRMFYHVLDHHTDDDEDDPGWYLGALIVALSFTALGAVLTVVVAYQRKLDISSYKLNPRDVCTVCNILIIR